MSPERPEKKRYRRGIALVALVFILFLLEMALRIVHLSSLVASDPGNFVNTERLENATVSRQVDDPVLGHRPNPDFFEHDAKGFRNKAVPAPGEVDIIALGDSQTYGTGVHRAEAWPRQLERITGHRVYSIAFGGYSPAHYPFLIDEALILKPRSVITAVYFGNDLLESFLFASREQNLNRFAPKNPKQFEQAIRLEKESPVTTEVNRIANDPEFFLAYENTSWVNRLAENVKIIEYALKLAEKISGEGDSPCAAPEQGIGPPPAHAAPTVLTPQYRLLTLDLQDVRVREGLRITQDALKTMHEKLKGAGVDHHVMFIPTKEKVYEEMVMQESPNEAFKRLVENETQAYNVLAGFLQEQGIPYSSTLPALKKSLWEGKTPYRNSSDGHPSPEGQRAIAECIAVFYSPKFKPKFDG